MEQAWSRIGIVCPDCKVATQLFAADCSADWEFRFTAFCLKCKENVVWRVFASQLIHRALENDIARCHTSPIIPARRAIQPPLQIPPEKLSEEDKKFMKDFGIDPNGGNGDPPKIP